MRPTVTVLLAALAVAGCATTLPVPDRAGFKIAMADACDAAEMDNDDHPSCAWFRGYREAWVDICDEARRSREGEVR